MNTTGPIDEKKRPAGGKGPPFHSTQTIVRNCAQRGKTSRRKSTRKKKGKDTFRKAARPVSRANKGHFCVRDGKPERRAERKKKKKETEPSVRRSGTEKSNSKTKQSDIGGGNEKGKTGGENRMVSALVRGGQRIPKKWKIMRLKAKLSWKDRNKEGGPEV